jgi:hypothetical protein
MFDWAEVIQTIGSTAIAVAAIAWLAKTLISESLKASLSKGVEKAKAKLAAENERELQEIRIDQEKERSDIRAEASERLEHMRAALTRIERLEADLYERRGESYGEIWTLTGALNLFGPKEEADQGTISRSLKNWYFANGWVLTEVSKQHYFLLQEVLSVCILKSLTPTRPVDELLYNDAELRPIQVLRKLRQALCAIPDRGEEGSYSLEDVTQAVSRWKADSGPNKSTSADEKAWVLFQFVLSTFRTRLAQELGSRRMRSVPATPNT